MPRTKSVFKSLRSSLRKRVINLRTKRKYKAAVKEVRDAVKDKDFKTAQEALPEAFKQLDLAAKKHIIHPNKADRLKSRLSQAVNRAGQPAES